MRFVFSHVLKSFAIDGQDFCRFGHAARADLPGSSASRSPARPCEGRLRGAGQVPLDGRLGPHFGVHRRGQQDGPRHSQNQRRQQVVGKPVCDAGQKVGGRRRNHENLAPASQTDVLARRCSLGENRETLDRAAGERLECRLADELRAARVITTDTDAPACTSLLARSADL